VVTFEEFLARKRQGAEFSLKPVAVSPDVELAGTDLQPESAMANLVVEEPSQVTAERQQDVAQKSGESHVPESPGVESPPTKEVVINRVEPSYIRDASAGVVDKGDMVQLSPEPTPRLDGVAAHPVTLAIAAGPPTASGERGEVPHVPPESVTAPIMTEPVIIVASEYPKAEPGTNPTELHPI
jgi:hypothetical protein